MPTGKQGRSYGGPCDCVVPPPYIKEGTQQDIRIQPDESAAIELRILHFSDLHLGVETHGRVDPSTGLHTRVRDFVRSLGFLCSVAIEEAVDLVLFTGDLYKNCDPTPTHQREFATQVRALQRAGIPLLMIVGNHDLPAAFGKATSLDIFATLEVEGTLVVRTPEMMTVPTASGPLQVAGLPWPSRHNLRAHENYKDLSQEETTRTIEQICTAQIEEFACLRKPEFPAILAGHLAAGAATFSGSERSALIGSDPTFLTGVLANPAFDYVALGHVHRFQDLNPTAPPPVVYAGSIERVDFSEENEEKGFCLVEIAREAGGWKSSYEFVPTPARRFVTITVDAASHHDPTAAVVAAIGEATITDAVVRLQYTVARDANPVDAAALHTALSSAHWVAGIHPQVAAEARERRAAVTGELDLADALDRYIANNPGLADHRDKLQACALELEQARLSGDRESSG